MQENFIQIGFAIAVIAFYIPFFLLMARSIGTQLGRRHCCISLKNIFEREKDNSRAIDQLYIIYRKVAENNSEFAKKYKSPIDICEIF